MVTATYYPANFPASNFHNITWVYADKTEYRNRAAYLERPSYCVLLVGLTYGDF